MNLIKKTWNDIPRNPKTVREFGFILTGVLLLFPAAASGLKVFFAHQAFHYGLGWPILSLIVLFVNLFALKVMLLIYRIAMFVAHGISWVVMRLILGVFFYLVLSPVSITMQLLGKDILDQKIDPQAASYWKKKTPPPNREQYERLF
ncbi:MAG: hypothetical protein HY351_00290 [Candidatus Omnitrophica bacterium]|nr:hypothetical protein [Candidatus Omnitrophota bacterium]